MTDSIFKFFIKSDMPCDIHQRNIYGHSLLILICDKPLSVYRELLDLGADAKALDYAGNNVLHHYFLGFRYSFDCIEKMVQCPAILETLILAGADHCHVNCRGQLPHEVSKVRPGMNIPPSIHLALVSCVWHEALRRIDLYLDGDFSIETPTKLQTYTDERPHCCLFHWRFFSWKQNSIHPKSLPFEDQMIAVLECWIVIQKMMAPFLSRRSLFRNTSRVAKIRESILKLKSKKAELDRAGTLGVTLLRKELYPPSEMELHQLNRLDCDSVIFVGATAKIDLPEVCKRCQRKIKEDWEGWEDSTIWEKWEDLDLWDSWERFGVMDEKEIDLNSQSEGHAELSAESKQETNSDTQSERDYFSAEEA